MDQFLQKIFRAEVGLQCRAIVAANAELARSTTDDEAWIALQNLLVASANASKLMWGSGGRAAAERIDLRSSLGVGSTSPLEDPDLRNDFEHCDERLAQHFADSTEWVRAYSGRNIGQNRATPMNQAGESREFHHFNPVTGVVTFWEHAASIPDLLGEAVKILTVLNPEESFGGVAYKPPRPENVGSEGNVVKMDLHVRVPSKASVVKNQDPPPVESG
jgi:hypothetical protein